MSNNPSLLPSGSPPPPAKSALETEPEVEERFTLSFYVPPSSLEACKTAIFAAGAGTYPGGRYSEACFVTQGTGQFLPMEGATPNIGSVGKLERVEECKVEVLCVGRGVMRGAVEGLRGVHPYEVVSYLSYLSGGSVDER